MIHRKIVKLNTTVGAPMIKRLFHLLPLLRSEVNYGRIPLACPADIVPGSNSSGVCSTIGFFYGKDPVPVLLVVLLKVPLEIFGIVASPLRAIARKPLFVLGFIFSHLSQAYISILQMVVALLLQPCVAIFQIVFAVVLTATVKALTAMTIGSFFSFGELLKRLFDTAFTAHLHTQIIPQESPCQ